MLCQSFAQNIKNEYKNFTVECYDVVLWHMFFNLSFQTYPQIYTISEAMPSPAPNDLMSRDQQIRNHGNRVPAAKQQ